MAHLDAATLDEFQTFNKTYYSPNNAVLVVAGDFKTKEATELIKKYFSAIPKGTPVVQPKIEEAPITETIKAEYQDPNIQIPAIVAAYRTPSMKEKDAYVLDMISSLLSDGKSSRLFKKVVDTKKMALQIGAFNVSQEDYGMYVIYGLPMGENTTDDLLVEIDEEIEILKKELISDEDYQKLQNKMENQFVNSNASIEGIAHSLANYYMLFEDVNLINNQIEIYRSITKEDIKTVANKYLNANQRLLLDYLPVSE